MEGRMGFLPADTGRNNRFSGNIPFCADVRRRNKSSLIRVHPWLSFLRATATYNAIGYNYENADNSRGNLARRLP